MSDRPLLDFIEEVNGGGHLRVEHDFGDGFVRLRTSEAERRQAAQDIRCSEDVVLELLRNSRDAHAAHVFLAMAREGRERLITVVDDGDGIPEAMHGHVFEPRVTSKLDTSHMDAWGLHGRGMALFSIAENAIEARVASSAANMGCAMQVKTDTSRLPEKADQSGFPRFELAEGGNVNVRGPKNILRCACEFAIEARDACAVHVGSPAEVASTLLAYGQATLSQVDQVFCSDASQLPVVKRLATASDPEDFAEMAGELGLALSPRTARRVMNGQIDVLPDLLSLIRVERPSAPGKRKRGGKVAQARRVRIQKAEADALAAALSDAYAPIAERYYLDASVNPYVTVGRDRIMVSIPLVEKP